MFEIFYFFIFDLAFVLQLMKVFLQRLQSLSKFLLYFVYQILIKLNNLFNSLSISSPIFFIDVS